MTNVLFVCSANRLRSPTAEQIFSTWPGVETDSAGISNGANVPLSSEQVEWADINLRHGEDPSFVMEKTHRNRLNRKFRSSLKGKRVICLDIPDDYEFMDPVLVRMLESRAGRFLPAKP
ncbi:phosphotyrosine protein phosphatase [Bradyrhizobium lablabi]|uniref:Phosphotyrosine protein phosphatase n=1 Tax=Bradyrhizobium lablabi TaxID=722472 RepID=A0A0R3MDM2_9BRAD|nr:low molecular weight protein tyrosine phosphatase family protein [Bradyrhizobium lablabi]KRR18185.1 phosphotyrosine protein phosphatase [Bradyrhizobium lablabi]